MTLTSLEFSSLESLDFKPRCSMGNRTNAETDFIQCEYDAVWFCTLVQPCCTKIVYCCDYHKERIISEWKTKQEFVCTTCNYLHKSSWNKLIISNFFRL